MILICVLGSGKGSWGHITRLVTDGTWDSIYIITNEWGKEKFAPTKEINWIIINENMGFDLMTDTITKALPKSKEIAVNFISGAGKLHMALVKALKQDYNNYKITILTKDGLRFY